MKTLILAAHPDDESLSCGGLIQNRLAQQGEVHVVSVFGRKYPVPGGSVEDAAWAAAVSKKSRQILHFRDAMKVFGIPETQIGVWALEEGEPFKHGYYSLLEPVEDLLRKISPDEVVIPCPTDLNQDHRHLHEVCKIALRPANLDTVQRVLMWHAHDGGTPKANWFESMTTLQLAEKIRAVGCYTDETRTGPHPRSPDNLEAHARVVGSQCGFRYAEPHTVFLYR